jgi:hypothetical protein
MKVWHSDFRGSQFQGAYGVDSQRLLEESRQSAEAEGRIYRRLFPPGALKHRKASVGLRGEMVSREVDDPGNYFCRVKYVDEMKQISFSKENVIDNASPPHIRPKQPLAADSDVDLRAKCVVTQP